ncbi:MAG: cysteine--tRNA ligase [Planctomycetes bacterium]|nr:cysteine--tRNA ligase [Planctomycetota bacterium]
MTLQLYNTLGRTKQPFEPLEEGRVRMYNCGPTVYSFAHLGNFASFLLADVLRRYLEYSGLEVVQVMNITDVGHLTQDDLANAQGEDKLEKAAREERKDPFQIARFYEEAFHEDRKILNLLPAAVYPRATEHIPEMIALIEELMSQGLAYESGGQIYFSIERYPRYGILSGNTTDELIAGHRVDTDPLKRGPLDFTLWKRDPAHLMQWDSPWGRGFPGWHIECSAMSRKYLGEVFDIHTGGEDNIFPHHECEIAQSSGGGDRVFARYWLHRRHILVDRRKMSKSAGNFFTIRDLLRRGCTGLEIRAVLIGTHYRSQLNFTMESVEGAREAIRYLREFRVNMDGLPQTPPPPGALDAIEDLARRWDGEFRSAMDDDLNVSGALAAVHGFVREAYKTCGERPSGERAIRQLNAWDRVLGILDPQVEGASAEGSGREPEGLSDHEVEDWVARRAEARRRRDFAESDRIRDWLRDRGIAIKDGREGTRWHRVL